jgi:hypothetical protein
MRFLLVLLLALLPLAAQNGALDWLNRNQSLLDAHNCYTEDGKWSDRIDRALAQPFPLGIEQDLAFAKGQVVVSHTDKTTGAEPTLRAHFFEKARPVIEKALRDSDRSRWPLIVLHFDFKDNQPEVLKSLWSLLGEYEAWITTAAKTADPARLSPFDVRPLLVLTEDPDAQEEVFYRQVPVGGKLRIFGSAHTRPIPSDPKPERERLMATLRPDELLSVPAGNYRRWWNLSWHTVELNGQNQAGEWTPADDRRLRSLVDHAHKLGYWIRFYTLDGFAPGESRGWTESYNFGSREAAAARWKAAISAGVNLIATDQYEDLAPLVRK